MRTNQAGPYVVVVTNEFGAVTSAVTTSVNARPPGQLRVLWSLAPNSRPYLTVTTLPYEHYLTAHAVTERLLVASRNGPALYVLDAGGGATSLTDVAGVSGGTYLLLMVGVAADNVVYGANLTLGAATDASGSIAGRMTARALWPAWLSPGTRARAMSCAGAIRWMLRGAGASTQILIGSRTRQQRGYFHHCKRDELFAANDHRQQRSRRQLRAGHCFWRWKHVLGQSYRPTVAPNGFRPGQRDRFDTANPRERGNSRCGGPDWRLRLTLSLLAGIHVVRQTTCEFMSCRRAVEASA